jgi:hypothetical protein
MSDYPFFMAACFLPQSVAGTINPGIPQIQNGSGTLGALNPADGLVLGQVGTGTADSGITWGLGRNFENKQPLPGSFTRPFSNRIGTVIDDLTITIPMSGNGRTASGTTGAQYEPDPGVSALLAAAGFAGFAITDGWSNDILQAQLTSGAVYFGLTSSNQGGVVFFRDLIATGAAFSFPPGSTGVVTITLVGIVDSINTGTHAAPPAEYEEQLSRSVPTVESAGFTWGPVTGGPVARSIGWIDMALAVNNDTTDVPASNVAGGSFVRQSDREVTASGTINATDAELLFELDQLSEEDDAQAEPFTFTIGAPAGDGNVMTAYKVTLPAPELVTINDAGAIGVAQGWTLDLIARHPSVIGAELVLEFV